MHTRPILVTGFEPFAAMDRNPSEDVVRAIVAAFGPEEMVGDILPVEYLAAERRMDQLIERHEPIAWLGFGLHQGADAIRLEQFAFNLDDAGLPDNNGEMRRGIPIDARGAESYRATLPLNAMRAELDRLGIPNLLSDSAGRFVCNHVFYHSLRVIGRRKSPAIVGFIHIPWPCDWKATKPVAHSIPLLTILRSGEACAQVVSREIRRKKISDDLTR